MSCDHFCIFLIFLKHWFSRNPTVNCHLFSFRVKQYLGGHFGVGSDVHSSLHSGCWNTTPDHPGKSAPSHLPCHTWTHPSGMLKPVTLKPSLALPCLFHPTFCPSTILIGSTLKYIQKLTSSHLLLCGSHAGPSIITSCLNYRKSHLTNLPSSLPATPPPHALLLT